MAKILIADDSPTELELFRRMLAGQGHEVLAALDGVEAEAMARREGPDLMILDIMMPRKNGFQVCRALKSDPGTANMPIVIVTSKGEDADVYWGRKQGADEYLVKPFKPAVLLEVVGRLLSRPAEM